MTNEDALEFNSLKAKQRLLRDNFPEPIGLRVHRAISWLGRADRERNDQDLRFILLWVAFNAAYAQDVSGGDHPAGREAFKVFFDLLVKLDMDKRIYNTVWRRFPNEIRVLRENKFVFAPFWHHHNGLPGYEDWSAGQNVMEFAKVPRGSDAYFLLQFLQMQHAAHDILIAMNKLICIHEGGKRKGDCGLFHIQSKGLEN